MATKKTKVKSFKKPMQEMSAGYVNPVAIAGSGPGGGSAYATGSGSVAIGSNGGRGYGAGGGGGKQVSGFTVGAGGGGKSAPHPGVGKGWPVYASDGQPGDKVEVIVPMEGAVAPGDSTVVTDPQPGLPGYVAMNPDGSFTAVPSIDAADLVILPATGDPDEVIIGVHDGIAGSGSLPDANPDEVDLAAGIFRHCGIQPDDDWVKRVERLNAIIDGLNGRGEAVGGAIVGTVVV